MTQEEIIEGNKLIAEFMGLEIITDRISWFDTSYKPLGKYHSSWDWLMPVVEKIIKEYRTDYYNEYDMCQSDLYSVTIGSDGKYSSRGVSKNTLIEATWLAVVEFIKWYNLKTK